MPKIIWEVEPEMAKDRYEDGSVPKDGERREEGRAG